MGKKIIFSTVIAFILFNLVLNPGTSRAENLKKGPEGTPSNSTTNLCKDSALAAELNQLSDKLGIKLDSCNDTRLMSTVADWLGTPYRHAGYSKHGIDCSGFVSKIYKEVYGINLTHSSHSMIYQMKELVRKDDLKEGDIIFFRIHGKRISHVGIYLKDGMFIHAAHNGIKVETLNCKYYQRAYYSAGRPDLSNRLSANK